MAIGKVSDCFQLEVGRVFHVSNKHWWLPQAMIIGCTCYSGVAEWKADTSDTGAQFQFALLLLLFAPLLFYRDFFRLLCCACALNHSQSCSPFLTSLISKARQRSSLHVVDLTSPIILSTSKTNSIKLDKIACPVHQGSILLIQIPCLSKSD